MVAFDHEKRRALITDADCDSWKCPECAKRMREAWVMRAQIGTRALIDGGATADFITLTSHEKLKTFSQCAFVWVSAWDKLYKALKRKNPDFAYMLIPEKHKDGRMHVHGIWNAGVSQKWLKDNARKRGLGYQIKVIRITEIHAVAAYVSKYVGKSLGDDTPAHFRRVRVSQNWAEIPVPVNAASGMQWSHISGNGQLHDLYGKCERDNYDIVDIRTGEIWDDIDLGTIVWGT